MPVLVAWHLYRRSSYGLYVLIMYHYFGREDDTMLSRCGWQYRCLWIGSVGFRISWSVAAITVPRSGYGRYE